MAARTRVCVYGVRDAEDATACAEGGADAVGLVFLPSSRRFVEPEDAWGVVQGLPPMVTTIGVFTDASVDRFTEIEEVCPTDYSQLHGDEDEETVKSCGPRVFKTVRAEEGRLAKDLRRWDAMDEVDAILVALGSAVETASGLEQIAAATADLGKPLLIGGGLTAQNVGAVVRAIQPWGVVVMGDVEGVGGEKEEGRVRSFCHAVWEADRALRDG